VRTNLCVSLIYKEMEDTWQWNNWKV